MDFPKLMVPLRIADPGRNYYAKGPVSGAMTEPIPERLIDISDDSSNYINNISLLTFAQGSAGDGSIIVSDGGGGEGIVTINYPEGIVDVSGDTGTLDNADLLHFTMAAPVDTGNGNVAVTNGGGGEAIITINPPSGRVDVTGASGSMDNAEKLDFIEGTITNLGGNEAGIRILPSPPGTGTFVLGSINNVYQWIGTTTC